MKAAGGYRQQGKNYIVEDGDIIFFKVIFNELEMIHDLNICLLVQCWCWSHEGKGREEEVKQKPRNCTCCIDQNCDHPTDQSTTSL